MNEIWYIVHFNKVEKLYHRGTELVQHANYGAAREVFSDFLAQASPTDARRGEAEYYVAFSALNLGHKDGEKLIDDFIDNNPSSPKLLQPITILPHSSMQKVIIPKPPATIRK